MAAFRPRIREIEVKSGNAGWWKRLLKDGEYVGAYQADIRKGFAYRACIDFLQSEGNALDANEDGIGVVACSCEQEPAPSAPQIHFDRFARVKERL